MKQKLFGRSVTPQFARKPQGDNRERRGAGDEQRYGTEPVYRERPGENADGLTDEYRRGKDRDGGAARVRRHLRGVGLQRVVQHVEAESDRDGRKRCEPPHRGRGKQK